jgi:hypothetical protein
VLTSQADGASDADDDELDDDVASTDEGDIGKNVPEDQEEGVGLYSGEELGVEEVSELASELPSRVVAVLGEQDAGKTCFLVCLYLMAMSGDLDDAGYLFAGSRTLPGFESRARSGRSWAEVKPERMSVRTTLRDGRGAGFMHLDLLNVQDGLRHRLLLSDLPGEWTNNLIDSTAQADRMSFVRHSDAILLMIDGRKLDGARRFAEVERTSILIDRLAVLAHPSLPPLRVLATRRDLIGTDVPPGLEEVVQYARSKGFDADGASIATYSGNPEVPTGMGILDILAFLLRSRSVSSTPPFPGIVPKRMFGWHPAMTETV